MAVDILNAISAYSKTQSLKGDFGNIAGIGEEKNAFSKMVDDIISSGLDSVKTAENVSIKTNRGEASVEDLAIAVANAEVSLKALVAIRDKIVTAYQDLIRMPI
jgi:flagellar hook-basal body complex protein FliE